MYDQRPTGQISADKSKNPIIRFIRFVFLLVRNYLILVGASVTLLSMLFFWALAQQKDRGVKEASYTKDHQAVINFTLSGAIAQREPDFFQSLMNEILGGPSSLYLPDIRSGLRRAAKDDRIAGLDIEINTLTASWAEMAELRRLLEDFRASGKPLRVLLNDASDWNYFIATAASQITINPATPVMIPGPVFQLLYFGDAIKKIGVTLEVVRAGKFKSAFEPFVRDDPTEPTLEEYRSLEENLRNYIVETVAKGRKKDPKIVRDWYKTSIFTAKAAKEAGIIDVIGYGDRTPEEERIVPETVKLGDYIDDPLTDKISEGENAKGDEGIALIEIVGEINMQPGGVSPGAKSDGIDPAQMHELVTWAREEKDVKAVVLRISSPGGSAVASDMIWHDLNLLAQEKPLVVSMGAYAASGGYYISAPAKRIIAEPTTITGSIGVIGMLPSFKQFKDKYGVSFHVVTQSDRQNLLNMGSIPSVEDKAMVEETIDQVYQTFLEKVATGRKMKVADVDALAQGRVYTGIEALKLGLVDELGGLTAAFQAAKELAGFDVKKLYPILRYSGKARSLADCLMMSQPRRIIKCMQGQTSLRIPEAQFDFLPVPAKAALDVTSRLRSWTSLAGVGQGSTHLQVLTLWPGYFSLSWQ